MTDYAGKEITVLVIMRGALEFYDELAEHGLKTTDKVKVTVMKEKLSSYVNKESSGKV